jgi:hypothetical protein
VFFAVESSLLPAQSLEQTTMFFARYKVKILTIPSVVETMPLSFVLHPWPKASWLDAAMTCPGARKHHHKIPRQQNNRGLETQRYLD